VSIAVQGQTMEEPGAGSRQEVPCITVRLKGSSSSTIRFITLRVGDGEELRQHYYSAFDLFSAASRRKVSGTGRVGTAPGAAIRG